MRHYGRGLQPHSLNCWVRNMSEVEGTRVYSPPRIARYWQIVMRSASTAHLKSARSLTCNIYTNYTATEKRQRNCRVVIIMLICVFIHKVPLCKRLWYSYQDCQELTFIVRNLTAIWSIGNSTLTSQSIFDFWSLKVIRFLAETHLHIFRSYSAFVERCETVELALREHDLWESALSKVL